ncbi:tetratricopeptide repeat protein, partial [bacterium]|nr:tetratricopeptide repeat protein [bacterium]
MLKKLMTGAILTGLVLCLASHAPAADAKAPADKAKPKAPKPKDPAAEKAEQIEKLFTDGTEAMFKGDYKQAIKLLSEAVAADETKTSYRLHLARAYRYDGQHAKAEPLLAAILKANPDHVEAGQLLARLYVQRKERKKLGATPEPLPKYRHDYSPH